MTVSGKAVMTTKPEDEDDFELDLPTLMPQLSSSAGSNIQVTQNGTSSALGTVVIGGSAVNTLGLSSTQQAKLKKDCLIFTENSDK